MKFDYYADTDSLYIDLSNRPSAESEEVAPGIVLDFDDQGHVVGIDIEDASKIVDLSRLESTALPLANVNVVARVAEVGAQ
ncbi:MAG TPA: DUF2283 domain-containing protein [Candidatus Kapabacteria bacterium]|nr:DUF2283 domain-containing protein [Candidatus Kapabacteria bacterium]